MQINEFRAIKDQLEAVYGAENTKFKWSISMEGTGNISYVNVEVEYRT